MQKKWEIFLPALLSLEAVMEKDIQDEFFRDSAIQRFEYTIEIFWKLLKSFLEYQEVEVTSPRDVIKKSCDHHFITLEESEYILQMLSYRNQTSHDYGMSIAKIVAPKLPAFTKMLRTISNRLQNL